jgi:Zn-dependent protease with chaperone function
VWPLYLPLVIPALAGLAARPLAERLEPRQATWLLTSAAVALASCSTAALALLAGFAAARAPVLAVLGHYSQSVMRRFDPIPVTAGAAAALALAGVSVGVPIIFRNRARGLAESYRRAACLPRDRIVVVPGPALDAYALPGRPGRIVVSDRLLDSLDPGRRAALIAHEQAHLAGRHHLFASVARLAAAANPMLLPVARTVEYTVERWADEHAAVVTGDRRLVAETIGQVALLASPRRQAPRVALGIAGQIAERMSMAWAGPVPRRVAALLGGPPRRRTVLVLASAAIVLLAGLSALEAARDLHALLELAQGGRDALHPWPPGFFPARITRLI